MAASLDWLLSALQSDDADVASLALLRLRQRVTAESTSLAGLAVEFSALPNRGWRRLGLLLFASDAVAVRAVVSIAVSFAGPEGKPVLRRIWQSDWRQFILDKLVDCATRAASTCAQDEVDSDGADVAVRLAIVLRAVFIEALQSGFPSAKDQARIINVFVHLTQSSVDAVAGVALQVVHALLRTRADLPLDSDVHSYLISSNVFPDLMAWIHASLTSAAPAKRSTVLHDQGHRHHRHRLVLDVLAVAASQNVDVAERLAQRQSDALLNVVLEVAESSHRQRDLRADHRDLQVRALELLAVVLMYDTPLVRELVSTIRIGGVLITVTWLLGHTVLTVRKAAHQVLDRIVQLSSPRDVTRALVEQGCVLICYTFLADERVDREDADDTASPCWQLLVWIVRQLESCQDQLVLSMVMTLSRSTNAKLQRNVVLSLLLLSESSSTVHDALFRDAGHAHFLHGIARDVIFSPDSDVTLATSLIAAALLSSDKSSVLKLETPASSIRSLSLRSVLEQPATVGQLLSVAIVCASGERVVVDSLPLVTHCKLFARELQRLHQTTTQPSLALVSFELPAHDAEAVRWLARLLPMAPQYAARELRLADDPRLVDQLLRLSKTVECTKCWHAATLAITHSLDASSWRSALDVAVELHHPALLLRALRAALATPTPAVAPGDNPVDTQTRDLKDAALLAWRELLAVTL